jgi:hypothetical protein
MDMDLARGERCLHIKGELIRQVFVAIKRLAAVVDACLLMLEMREESFWHFVLSPAHFDEMFTIFWFEIEWRYAMSQRLIETDS